MVTKQPTKLCERCGSPRTRCARRYCWPCGIAARKRADPVARFWNNVTKTDSCWLWTCSKKAKGYGQYTVWPGHVVLAHRYAYELMRGPIPDGLGVLHRCDNPPCVNPDHMFLGTRADNNRDMVEKGRARHSGPRGEANSSAKLTEDSVRAIRRERADGAKLLTLARRFNVSIHVISAVARRKLWKHVP